LRFALLVAAAIFMTVDAVGYSFGAIRRIEAGLAPAEGYWRLRLRLNLLLANHALYLAAAVAWVAVVLAEEPRAVRWLSGISALSALYSVVTILAFTRRDFAHAIPRGLALVAYAAAFLAG
jgi:hypothetical protein